MQRYISTARGDGVTCVFCFFLLETIGTCWLDMIPPPYPFNMPLRKGRFLQISKNMMALKNLLDIQHLLHTFQNPGPALTYYKYIFTYLPQIYEVRRSSLDR